MIPIISRRFKMISLGHLAQYFNLTRIWTLFFLRLLNLAKSPKKPHRLHLSELIKGDPRQACSTFLGSVVHNEA